MKRYVLCIISSLVDPVASSDDSPTSIAPSFPGSYWLTLKADKINSFLIWVPSSTTIRLQIHMAPGANFLLRWHSMVPEQVLGPEDSQMRLPKPVTSTNDSTTGLLEQDIISDSSTRRLLERFLFPTHLGDSRNKFLALKTKKKPMRIPEQAPHSTMRLTEQVPISNDSANSNHHETLKTSSRNRWLTSETPGTSYWLGWLTQLGCDDNSVTTSLSEWVWPGKIKRKFHEHHKKIAV